MICKEHTHTEDTTLVRSIYAYLCNLFFSYAKAAQNANQNNQMPAAEELRPIRNEEQNLVTFMKESFLELKEMFRDLMKQNSVMINLLTALIGKMK